MKTIKRNLLVVVFMLGTFINYANNKELNNVLDAKKVKIVFKGTKKGHQLTVKNDNGNTLHLENITKAGNFIKFFDFSKLKDGTYTLELEKDFEIIIKSIKIKGDNVIFDEDSKETIFKPVVRNKENILMITQIAFDKKPLFIKIYYENEIIYAETLKGKTILNRVYRLDNEIKGDYKVIIYNNGRSYLNEFKI